MGRRVTGAIVVSLLATVALLGAGAPAAGDRFGGGGGGGAAGGFFVLLVALVALLGAGAPAASAAPNASPVWVPKASFGGPAIYEAPSNPLAIDSQQNILVANQDGPV